MALDHRDHTSDRARAEMAAMHRHFRRMQKYGGYAEVATTRAGGEGPEMTRKEWMLPLLAYRYHIQMGKYPPEDLLRWLDRRFRDVLDGSSFEEAFFTKQPRGRPRLSDTADESHDRELLALKVKCLIESPDERKKMVDAIEKHCSSKEGRNTMRRLEGLPKLPSSGRATIEHCSAWVSFWKGLDPKFTELRTGRKAITPKDTERLYLRLRAQWSYGASMAKKAQREQKAEAGSKPNYGPIAEYWAQAPRRDPN